MAVKIKMKQDRSMDDSATNAIKATFAIPRITGSTPPTPNIIIRAVKIMLMDIRKRLYPNRTAEDLEKYSQFSNYAYGRR